MEYTAQVWSSVVFVSELDLAGLLPRGVRLRVAIREQGAALMLAPGGFQLYLVARGDRAQHPSGGIGHEFLMWANDSHEGLEQELRASGHYDGTHASGNVRFVEGHDPDGIRVVVAHPSPEHHPRSVLDPRFYNCCDPRGVRAASASGVSGRGAFRAFIEVWRW